MVKHLWGLLIKAATIFYFCLIYLAFSWPRLTYGQSQIIKQHWKSDTALTAGVSWVVVNGQAFKGFTLGAQLGRLNMHANMGFEIPPPGQSYSFNYSAFGIIVQHYTLPLSKHFALGPEIGVYISNKNQCTYFGECIDVTRQGVAAAAVLHFKLDGLVQVSQGIGYGTYSNTIKRAIMNDGNGSYYYNLNIGLRPTLLFQNIIAVAKPTH